MEVISKAQRGEEGIAEDIDEDYLLDELKKLRGR